MSRESVSREMAYLAVGVLLGVSTFHSAESLSDDRRRSYVWLRDKAMNWLDLLDTIDDCDAPTGDPNEGDRPE